MYMLQTYGKYIVASHMQTKTAYSTTSNMGFETRGYVKPSQWSSLKKLHEKIAAGKQTDILLMDFSKAFDEVCHSLLKSTSYATMV